MATSAGRAILFLRASSFIALRKHADQPAANNCSGLLPLPGLPGAESLTSRLPSEVRDAPPSRLDCIDIWRNSHVIRTWSAFIGGLFVLLSAEIHIRNVD